MRVDCPNDSKDWQIGGYLPELAQFNQVSLVRMNHIYWNGLEISLQQLADFTRKHREWHSSTGSGVLVLNYEGYVDCRLLDKVRTEMDKNANCGEVLCIENFTYF